MYLVITPPHSPWGNRFRFINDRGRVEVFKIAMSNLTCLLWLYISWEQGLQYENKTWNFSLHQWFLWMYGKNQCWDRARPQLDSQTQGLWSVSWKQATRQSSQGIRHCEQWSWQTLQRTLRFTVWDLVH